MIIEKFCRKIIRVVTKGPANCTKGKPKNRNFSISFDFDWVHVGIQNFCCCYFEMSVPILPLGNVINMEWDVAVAVHLCTMSNSLLPQLFQIRRPLRTRKAHEWKMLMWVWSAIYGTRYIINDHFLHAAASRLHISYKSINFATMRIPRHIIYALRAGLRAYPRFIVRFLADLVVSNKFRACGNWNWLYNKGKEVIFKHIDYFVSISKVIK